jgi:hypothetical protein
MPTKENDMGRALRLRLALLIATGITVACVEYVPVPASSTYDRAWNAALGGVQDAGVTITQAEPTTGVIRGTRNGINVTVSVARHYDGTVRVQFDTKGDTSKDPQLSNRFSHAYERRMGR